MPVRNGTDALRTTRNRTAEPCSTCGSKQTRARIASLAQLQTSVATNPRFTTSPSGGGSPTFMTYGKPHSPVTW